MATSIQPRAGGRQQLRVIHRLLPRPFFFTFSGADALEQATSYRDQLMALLAKNTVPHALLARMEKQPGADPMVVEIVSGFEATAPADSTLDTLKLVRGDVTGMRMSQLSYEWVEEWVRRLKVESNLAPGSIRKRVGALARAVDWHHKRTTPKGQTMPANPLRLLPRGYSQYAAAEVPKDGERKVDTVRDRRLLPDEERRVRLTLSGTKRGDRERALPTDPEFTLLFELILDTGLRLREAYRLTVDQVDLTRGVLRLEGSKGARGQRKPRVVPLKKHLRPRLAAWCRGKKGRVFPTLWDGSTERADLNRTTARLSGRFLTLFDYADVHDFSEHDLRHEATCRWFELRNPRGGWMFSEIEVCRIMGWTDPKLALRYASLRGEDLADRLL